VEKLVSPTKGVPVLGVMMPNISDYMQFSLRGGHRLCN